MPKNYENNPEQAQYIKESLAKRYPEVFEKYEIQEISHIQVCHLADFLSKEDKEQEKRKEPEEQLKKIFSIIDLKNNRAILINTNQEEQEGEIGVYDLENHIFHLTNSELREKIEKSLLVQIEQYAKNVYSPNQIKEMIEQMMPKTLEQMSQRITIKDEELDKKAEKLVKYDKIDEINQRNGKSKKERQQLESKKETQTVVIGQQEEKEKHEKVPEDVVQACQKLGITQIKGYFYVNAKQLEDKIDAISVNPNAGRVLMIKVANTSNLAGPDRYFGIQNNRMILYGTQDKQMEQVVQNKATPPIDGKLIEPLQKNNPTYVEFSDSERLIVNEKLEENMNLSLQDLENYKKQIEQLLEQYSQNVIAIEENNLLNAQQKKEMLLQNNQNFERLNAQVAQKYGIDKSDVKAINLQKTKYQQDVQEQLENEDEEEPDPHEQWWEKQRRK